MTKKPFSDYRPTADGTGTIDEAISELQREMDVRRRIFDKWVETGRLSWVDANDRLRRHMSALRFLIAYSTLLDNQTSLSSNPDDQPDELLSPEQLDAASNGVPA